MYHNYITLRYVTGDFNVDLLKYDTCSKHKEFLNTMTSFGFLPHILQPSRITESSATLIDNIMEITSIKNPSVATS